MAGTTSSNAAILSPEQVQELVVRPVAAQSVAMLASTVQVTGSNSTRVPIVTEDPQAAWISEGGDIPANDLGADEIDVIPTKVAAGSLISRELAEDSDPGAANIVGAALVRDIVRKIDEAWLGAVASPAPQGLGSLSAYDVGTPEVDGYFESTWPAWENLDPFAEAISIAQTEGHEVGAFVANPADALALSQLKDQTGSNRPLLGMDPTRATGRMALGVQILVSPYATAGTIWGVPKATSLIIVRSDARVDRDESYKFMNDQVAVRATMRVGFAFPHQKALVKITADPGGS